MTTIAYRDGVMAADRLVTADGVRLCHARKIVRSADGHMGGAAGDAIDAALFLTWIGSGCDGEPPTADSMEGIAVFPDGRVFLWEGTEHLAEMQGPFFALGSGCLAALAAMTMGADAERAVQVAAELDTSTGGGIDVLRQEVTP